MASDYTIVKKEVIERAYIQCPIDDFQDVLEKLHEEGYTVRFRRPSPKPDKNGLRVLDIHVERPYGLSRSQQNQGISHD